MTINKIPIYPHMIRQVPEQFSWIDQRLVRESYIDYLSHQAATLYLFLVTVSDAQGLSYYGDVSLQKRLSMEEDTLTAARETLVRERLIGFKKPLYQVLALDNRRKSSGAGGEPSSMSQILQQMMGGGS